MMLALIGLSLFFLGKPFFGDPLAGLEKRPETIKALVGLMRLSPAGGATPGNLEYLLPQVQEYSYWNLSEVIAADWLLLLGTVGVPGLAMVLALTGSLFLQLMPFGNDRQASARSAAFAPLATLVVTSFFLAPGHQLAIMLLAALLLKLSIQPPNVPLPCVFAPVWYRLTGVALLLIASAWVISLLGATSWHTELLRERTWDFVQQHAESDPAATQQALNKAIPTLPLHAPFYLARAKTYLETSRDLEAAQRDFTLARQLAPYDVSISLEEGAAWINFSRRHAMEAWKEALQRPMNNPDIVYEIMIEEGSRYPFFRTQLSQLSLENPHFRYKYLSSLEPSRFAREIRTDLEQHPGLRQFEVSQRLSLAEQWVSISDINEMLLFVRDHREDLAEAWYFEARALVAAGEYHEAIEITRQMIVFPKQPDSLQMRTQNLISQGMEKLALTASEPSLVQLQLYLNSSENDKAFAVAESLIQEENPEPYAQFWAGELARRRGDDAAAWDYWKPYLIRQLKGELTLTPIEVTQE